MTAMSDTIRVSDIVTAREIAERAGVSRSTVGHWMARFADFPDAICHVGAGRQAPRGRKSAGHALRDWSEVREWLVKTGRMAE